MAPDFRKPAKNTNNKKGGVNPPSSFQGEDEAKNLIEKNLKEGYDEYYSKYEDPLSRAVNGIVRGGDFSPEAVKRKANQIKLEEINKLRSKYPGKFKDEDFSLDNIEKLSSDEPDTITQKTFRDLKNEIAKKGDMVSAEAIDELAELEYFSKRLEELEERARIEIANKKAEGELKDEGKDDIKDQKKDKQKVSNLSIRKQKKEKAEKSEKDKDKETKSEKKPEKSELTENKIIADVERRVELDSDDEVIDYDDEAAVFTKKDNKKTTEHFKSVPNFDDKAEKIKKDIEASKEKQKAKKETEETPIEEQAEEAENKDGLDELDTKEKMISDKKREVIKKYREKQDAENEERRKIYGEAMKELEGIAKEEGFKGLDIDRPGVHMGTDKNRVSVINYKGSNEYFSVKLNDSDNKKVEMGEESLKNFNEWMQIDPEESKKGIKQIFQHEAQHHEGPAKKSGDASNKKIAKLTNQKPQIIKEASDKYYFGEGYKGRGYEMQTEVQRHNQNFKNIDDFIETQAKYELASEITHKGLKNVFKKQYMIENADEFLPIQRYNFIKPELIKKVIYRMEEMREDLADKYEIKKNKDNLKIFSEILSDPASGGLGLARKMLDNANAKIDFLTKKIYLRNELRKLVKDEAEKTGKNEEEILNSINENKEYQKNLLEKKLNQININIADSKFRDDPEKIKVYEDEKEKIVGEYKETLLKTERDFREYIDKTIDGLNNIKNSEESPSGKESGMKGLSSYFELAVKAYGNEIENNEELKKIVEDTRELLKDSIESKTGDGEKTDQDRALPAFPLAPVSMPMPASMPMPTLSSAPHVSRTSPRASASSYIPALSHISIPSPASSSQTPSPSRGSVRSSSGQSGKISTKLTPSTPASSSLPQASPASSAPASAAAPASASKTSPARAASSVSASPQTAAPEPASTPAHTPASQASPAHTAPASAASSQVSSAPQTASEPASTPASAPASQTTTEPAPKSTTIQPQASLSQDAARQPMNNAEQMSHASPTPSQAMPESASLQTKPEPVSTHMPPPPSVVAPSVSPQSTPAKTSPSSQGSTEPSIDSAQEENGGGMSKETIEEIKEKVKKQLEDSLEKNIDNGMGGVAIQDGAGKSDADKIKMIKAMAEQKNLNDQRNRISLINSAIKMDGARVDPADREAETQRIKQEAEEKMEKEIRKEIGGVKGKVASKVLSKVMGLAAYKMAQELSRKANKGKHQLGLVVVVTLALAVAADLIDIARDTVAVGSATTVILFILGAAWWLILLLASSFLTTIISIFWMQLAGGGHSKLMWRFLIKTVLAISFNAVPFFGDIPFTVIIVLWNWYDFAKERRKDRRELKTFIAKNKSLLRNVSVS